MTRWNDVPEHGDDVDLVPVEPVEPDYAAELWQRFMTNLGLAVLVLLGIGLVFGVAGYLTGGHGA